MNLSFALWNDNIYENFESSLLFDYIEWEVAEVECLKQYILPLSDLFCSTGQEI